MQSECHNLVSPRVALATKDHPDIKEVLFTAEEVSGLIENLGEQISKDYAGKNPLLVAVLRGAVIFTADLMRAITCPLAVDFMAISSYGDGVKSSGVVRIVKDLDTQIEGRDVLVVEDILDSGLTLNYLTKNLESRHPASVKVATLLVKDIADKKPSIEPDYVGAHIPDAFVVGYGFDYAERYRNLPYIGVLKPEVYS